MNDEMVPHRCDNPECDMALNNIKFALPHDRGGFCPKCKCIAVREKDWLDQRSDGPYLARH